MKKICTLAVLALLAMGLQANTADVSTDYGTISVNTSASKSIAPDTAQVSIAVITEDTKSMQEATRKNRETSDKVIAALKSMINTSNGDYIKTSDFNANPVYRYTKDNKKILEKYQVSNSVIVQTKSIDKIGTMIDKSLSLGATNVNSLNFTLSNQDSLCNILIEQASKKASERVNAAAKSVPAKVTGIKSMNVSCSDTTPVRPKYQVAKTMLMSAGTNSDAAQETSVSIEEGLIKLNATVSATYYVK
ncbi:SIMPL domain-containing protein [bacterium]|nr:SIMPL domain-containing protein [bacterium]